MVSGRYIQIDHASAVQLSAKLKNAWHDPSIPAQQEEIAGRELDLLKGGMEAKPFSNFLSLVRLATGSNPCDLLEVGCGAAYYSDVLKLGGLDHVRYHGLDYSPAFRAWVKEKRPDVVFYLGDIQALPFTEPCFDIVMEGCSMLHVYRWKDVVREAARVSRKYVIFHRTPLSISGVHEHWQKEAYGVPCYEQHFCREELNEEWGRNGLSLVQESVIFDGPNYACSSFLLEKRGA